MRTAFTYYAVHKLATPIMRHCLYSRELMRYDSRFLCSLSSSYLKLSGNTTLHLDNFSLGGWLTLLDPTLAN